MRSAFSFASLQSGQEEKTENWETFNHSAGDKYQLTIFHKMSHTSSGLIVEEILLSVIQVPSIFLVMFYFGVICGSVNFICF